MGTPALQHRSIDTQTIVLAVCSGLLLTASFPRFGHGLLAWIALVPLLMSLRNLTRFDAFRIGFLAGLVHYVTLLYWFVPFFKTYGPFPVYLSVLILLMLCAFLALFIAVFCLMVAWLCPSILSCVVYAALGWVSLEYVRSFLFTGFPWELLGYSQYEALLVIQIADALGVYGVSFAIVLSNAILFAGFLFATRRTWQGRTVSLRDIKLAAVLGILLWCTLAGYGAWRIQSMDRLAARSPVRRIAVIQGNIDQTLKWNPSHQLATIGKYLNLSLARKADQPDLVVWPETAMPFYLYHQAQLTRMVVDGIITAGTDFLVSSPYMRQEGGRTQYLNRAFLIRADGRLAGTYDKAHLVPFGEYVPLKSWLPFLGKMVAQVGDFSPGKPGETLLWGQSRIGMLICYELIFPYLSRAAARNGADLLVNITNDAWYGRSSAPHQHFSMAVFRSVENRRALVRSANTGISGFIDPAGRIVAATPIFQEASLTKTVPLINIASVYTRIGDVFARACVILVVALAIRRRQASRGGGNHG